MYVVRKKITTVHGASLRFDFLISQRCFGKFVANLQ